MDKKKLKRFLQKVDGSVIDISKASELLAMDGESATNYLSELEDSGYVQKTSLHDSWVVAMRGKLLAQTHAKRVFKVSSLKKELLNFLERVEHANSSEEYTCTIRTVLVSSQYPITETSNGIKIKYNLEQIDLQKEELEKRQKKLRKRKKGDFNNFTERFFYPEEAIHIFLKSRSHMLHLERMHGDEINSLSGFIAYKYPD